MKSIIVEEKVWKELMKIRIETGARTMNQVILMLLKNQKKEVKNDKRNNFE